MDIQSLELDIACYATAVYHEVNNRTLEEKIGVINVIRNRVRSGLWGLGEFGALAGGRWSELAWSV